MRQHDYNLHIVLKILVSIPIVLLVVLPYTIINFFYKLRTEHDWVRMDYDKAYSSVGYFLVDTWLGDKEKAQNNRVFVLFLIPSLGSFILFVAFPFFQGILFSLTNWDGLNTGREEFIWFANYANIFSSYEFAYSFVRTVTYSVLNIIFINLVAFGLALIVVQNLKFKNIYRAAFFMPNLIGGLILGYIWQFVFNRAVVQLGGFFEDSLLLNGNSALIGIIIVVTWQYAGYIMMIYIAALQNVPQDLIEASKIDGANAWQRLRTITFPMIAQAFTVAMFLTLTTSFKQYDTVVSLTQGGPPSKLPLWLANLFNVGFQPAVEALDFLAVNIYDEAFVIYELGVGQAKAVTFFIVLLIVSLVQVYYNKRREVEL